MHGVIKSWVDKRYKFQDSPMGINVTEYKKFIGIISDSTLQPTFEKLQFVVFGLVSINNICN